MSNYLSLVKVFLRSLSMRDADDKKKKTINKILVGFVSLFVMLPFALICMFFVMSMTGVLKEYGYATTGLEVMCIVISIFSFIFGFNVILNEFYFTGDVENLLPLPIKPFQIIAAKFSAAFIAETLMQLIIVVFSVIGYYFGAGIEFYYFILGILGMFTLPLIPMIYCGIISILLMSFTKFIKNKETVKKIGLGFIVALLLVAIYALSGLTDFNIDTYIERFVNGDKSLLYTMRWIFPHIHLFIDTISTGSISSLLLYILVNILYVLVFLGLAQGLYFKGLVGLNVGDTASKKGNSLDDIKVESPVLSYFKKEMAILFRTTAYFSNCILINFIWPLLVYVIYKLRFSDISFCELEKLARSCNGDFLTIILLFVVSISILLPAINSIAASSFSREGKNFDFMKSVPLEYDKQIMVKALVSISVAFIGFNLFALIFYVSIGLPLVMILFFVLVSFLCVLFVTFLGIVIDSINPKLIWDDELNALRENSNNFIVMGIVLLLFGLFLGGGYFLYKNNYGIDTIAIIIFSILFVLNILLLVLNKKFTVKNILELE